MTELPHQVTDFISQSSPFDLMIESMGEEKARRFIAQFSQYYITEACKDDCIRPNAGALFLIQSGHFAVSSEEDDTQKFLSEGDYFGFESGLLNRFITCKLKVETPGLVYCLPFVDFMQCMDLQPKIRRFFRALMEKNLHQHELNNSHSKWLYTPISSLIGDQLVTAGGETKVCQAAREMKSHKVSSILVTQNDTLIGIVTDRDIRSRVVAENLSLDTPLKDIMSSEPVAIKAHKSLFDALSLMASRNIHHLPIVDDDGVRAIGVLTASDMLKHQRSSILFLIHELGKCSDRHELVQASRKIREYFSQHARRVGDFDIAGKILAQATDLMTNKLIEFFECQSGKAPFDFCWLAFGSQAREDQNLGSDQDNALLLAQVPKDEEAAYFKAMADYVCEGLGRCGVKLCNGNIMASNPDLRKALSAFVEQARSWVQQPTPEAIMHFNIFLDVRCVAGEAALLEQLHGKRAPLFTRSIFLAALARHMNQAQVPLSIFGKFTSGRADAPKGSIDLKTQGIAIINELVRLYALDSQITDAGTIIRLKKLVKNKTLTEQDSGNLQEVWLFINRLRWRHQIEHNCDDNFVALSELSSLEKHQLKNAFDIIKRAQQIAIMKYAGGIAG